MPSLLDDPTRASRYLADQLSEAECAEYEARLTQDPEAVAELEATARLKIGLKRLRQSGELSELLAGAGGHFSNRTLMLAIAAGIGAIVIGASLWFPHVSPSSSLPVLASRVTGLTDRNGHGLSVVSTTPLFRTRAERYDAVIDLPALQGAIRLRLLPSRPADSAHYQATLARIKDDGSPEAPVAIGNLQPSAEDGFVDVYADSSLLSPGRYRITLTRETGGPRARTVTLSLSK